MKDFIPYEQALALKELGFDEPCFLYQNSEERKLNLPEYEWFKSDNQDVIGFISIPLYSQAFRWFRKKHKLHHRLHTEMWECESLRYSENIPFESAEPNSIECSINGEFIKGKYSTYEEAELACLIKLINIVKTK